MASEPVVSAAMAVLEAIRNRRSVRAFRPDPIPEEAMLALKEALRWAPSAGNLESRHFHFVHEEALRRRLAEAAFGQDFVARAPLVVVCSADRSIERRYGRRGLELYMLQDVAASIQNLLLAAHALGLGAVWVGAIDEGAVARALQLEAHLRVVALVPVGFAAENPEPPRRSPLHMLVTDVGRPTATSAGGR